MNTRRRMVWLLLGMPVLLASPPTLAQQGTAIAVFNFQMKSGTHDWVWLEKFLSDQITTDFFRGGLAVVARDEMQLLAGQMSWVPEMATADGNAAGRIRQALKIEQLVTGVCSVEAEELCITAQVVRISDRTEVFRHTVKGNASEALRLQKRLSAELLAWFTQGRAEQILEKLPVWTKSLPAVKALYEGMDLYDQGRYGEGWLKFRQASREDAGYVEAVYWVGKMYYFMQRYDHARRELERFVYLDPLHPRMREALAEFLHTYEKSLCPPEDLLALYQYVRDRHPNVLAPERGGDADPMDMDTWARNRMAALLARLGRYKESALAWGPGGPGTLASADALNALTGEVLGEKVLFAEPKYWYDRVEKVFMDKGRPEADYLLNERGDPVPIVGKNHKDENNQPIKGTAKTGNKFILAAPSGYGFKSIRFRPVMYGDDAVMTVAVSWANLGLGLDANSPRMGVTQAREKGLLSPPLPPVGYVNVSWEISTKNDDSPQMFIRGIRMAAELEKIDSHGSIDVSCAATPYFLAEVDGIPARKCPGLAGPLREGNHTVRLTPLEKDGPYGEWRGTVTVAAGRTVPLRAMLPWKKDGPWQSWKGLVLPASHVVTSDENDWRRSRAPALVIDAKAIRLLWSDGQDLWTSTSTDGRNYSEPARLDLPVSSAWREDSPRCIRDESGRFVMTFVSDRDPRHGLHLYTCWSHDFAHWSAPAIVPGEYNFAYDFIQDRAGRYLLALASPHSQAQVLLLASRDLASWERIGAFPWPRPSGYTELKSLYLSEAADGSFQAWLVMHLRSDPNAGTALCRARSQDGTKWSELETVFHRPKGTWDSAKPIHPVRGADRPAFLVHNCYDTHEISTLELLAECPDGRWRLSQQVRGLTPGVASACRHPDWGTILAWAPGERRLPPHLPHAGDGPTVLRGGELPDVLPATVQVPSPPVLVAARPRPTSAPAELPEGQLRYVRHRQMDPPYGLPRLYPTGVLMPQPVRFEKPPRGAGTTHPSALLVALPLGDANVVFALDILDPNQARFDLLRVDLTGRGAFADANVLRRKELYKPAGGRFGVHFEGPLETRQAGQKVSDTILCIFEERDSGRFHFKVSLPDFYAEARCRFGEKVYKLVLVDATGNLRFDDRPRMDIREGRVEGYFDCDWTYVLSGSPAPGRVAVAPAGQPVLVDGRLYTVQISADRKSVAAEPYAGATGKIQIDRPLWTAVLATKDSVQFLCGGKDLVPAPAGEYVILYFCEWAGAAAGRDDDYLRVGTDSMEFYVATVEAANRPENRVTIRDGQTTTVRTVGSPVTTRIVVQREGAAFTFCLEQWRDAGGRLAWLITGQVRFQIVDAQGKVVDEVAFAPYRGGTWKIPSHLHGAYTVRLKPDFGFPADVKPVAIKID